MLFRRRRADLIADPPGRALLLFAFPIFLGNLFQQFYNMVDSITVGKFVSQAALASVGASYAITNVFIAVAIGGGIGSAVIISQYFGAGQIGKMKTSVYTALLNFLVVGVALGAIGMICCPRLLAALHTPAAVFHDAEVYLRIYFWGLPFLFLYNVESAIFNSLGDSETPLMLLIFSSLLNIGLDLLFVVAFGLGVAGVAVATLIAQGLSAVLSFAVLLKKLRGFSPDAVPASIYSGGISLRMLAVAVPSVIQQAIVNVGMLLVQSVVNSFGEEALAGYSAGMRYEAIGIVPMNAVGSAVSTFTAQNIGAGNLQRVKEGYRASYRILFCCAAAICAAYQLFAAPLLSAFLDADAGSAAFATGLEYLRFISFFFVLIGLKMATDGLLRGAGDVGVFTIANLVNLGIRVWFAFRFAPLLGIKAVWIAVPVGWAANYLISFCWVLTGRWSRKRVIGK